MSLLGLASAARARGYAATGRRITPQDLSDLPHGTILHWGGNHFVVLVGTSAKGVRVLDPAFGERLVSREVLARQLSGTALIVTATEASVRAERRRTPRLSPYRPFLRGGAGPLRRTVGWAVAAQLLALAYPLLLSQVVSDATSDRSRSVGILLLLAGATAGAFLLATVGRLLSLLALQRLVDVRLSTGVLQHLVSLPFSFLSRRATGDLALRLRSTVVVRQILTTAALSALLDGTLVLLYLALIAIVDGGFALLTLAVIALQAALVAVTWPRLRRAAAEALEAQTRSQNELLEIVEGIEVLKATGAAARATTAWEQQLHEEVRAQIRSSRLSGLVDAALATVRFAAPLVLLAVGLTRVEGGQLSLGDMLGVAALAAAVTVPTGALLSTVCSLSTVVGYVERLDDLLAAEPERAGSQQIRRRGPLTVDLRGVSFSYSALLQPALQRISLTIEPGEHVAVVGSSGSGKSTLAMLVAGLYEPSSGSVWVNGVDVRDYDPDDVRSRIGVVTQTTALFSRSLEDNITFGREDVTPRRVVAAAKAAAVHDDITALPSGYATRLGNGGSGLSGGQRQRLALARALAGKPGLLVLDEATSALDAATEARVQDALTALRCTRLVIAHRMTTVRAADRVVVLDRGQIVDEGSYVRLARRSDAFRALLSQRD